MTATPTVRECLGSDSWGAEEIDYINSEYNSEKKDSSSRKSYEMIKLSFGDVFLVTD